VTILDLIILALATYRLSELLANEDGPAGIFARLRKWLGVEVNEYSQLEASNIVAEMVICTYCNSFWLGVFWCIALYAWSGVLWLALPFALSGFVVLVDKLE